LLNIYSPLFLQPQLCPPCSTCLSRTFTYLLFWLRVCSHVSLLLWSHCSSLYCEEICWTLWQSRTPSTTCRCVTVVKLASRRRLEGTKRQTSLIVYGLNLKVACICALTQLQAHCKTRDHQDLHRLVRCQADLAINTRQSHFVHYNNNIDCT